MKRFRHERSRKDEARTAGSARGGPGRGTSHGAGGKGSGRSKRHPGSATAKSPDSARYVVTGGAGFVGSNLVAALAKLDPTGEIIVIDDFRTGSTANIVEAFDREGLAPFSGVVLPVSIEDLDFEPLLESMDVRAFFHLAAITDTTVTDESAMLSINATPMMSIMQACVGAGVPLVYASSAATYGTPPQTASRQAFPLGAAGRPNNVYGFSKWLMECEHRRLAEALTSPPQIVGLRYFNVFGPGESRKGKMASMAYQLAQQMLSGKSPRLFADGSQSRDQVYVADVVACTLAAAGLGSRPDPAPGIYNLGSGVATSFSAVADAVRRGLGVRDLPTEYFEMPEHIRAFYQDFTQADMIETTKGLGWTPAHDPISALESYGRFLAR